MSDPCISSVPYYEKPKRDNRVEQETKSDDRREDQQKGYDYINPDHYKSQEKEVWEMMVDIWGVEKFITYCEINAFKYRMRMGRKPSQPVEQDLKKAKWYETKAKELKGGYNRLMKERSTPMKFPSDTIKKYPMTPNEYNKTGTPYDPPFRTTCETETPFEPREASALNTSNISCTCNWNAVNCTCNKED